MTTINHKDAIGGGLFALIGLYFLLGAFEYPIGTARAMGPGYIPMLLGGLAIMVGLLIAGPALVRRQRVPTTAIRPAWRPMALVLSGILVFGVVMEFAGLLPAIFALVAVSALGEKKMRPIPVLILAFATTAGIWLVFHIMLAIPAPLCKGVN